MHIRQGGYTADTRVQGRYLWHDTHPPRRAWCSWRQSPRRRRPRPRSPCPCTAGACTWGGGRPAPPRRRPPSLFPPPPPPPGRTAERTRASCVRPRRRDPNQLQNQSASALHLVVTNRNRPDQAFRLTMLVRNMERSEGDFYLPPLAVFPPPFLSLLYPHPGGPLSVGGSKQPGREILSISGRPSPLHISTVVQHCTAGKSEANDQNRDKKREGDPLNPRACRWRYAPRPDRTSLSSVCPQTVSISPPSPPTPSSPPPPARRHRRVTRPSCVCVFVCRWEGGWGTLVFIDLCRWKGSQVI